MIKIVADTVSSLPVSLAHELDIPYLPQIIIFGEESYRDDSEITTPIFLQKLKASPTLPKTAAPPPLLYTPIYEEYAKPGNTVFVLAPSAEVSGTYRSAVVAAQDFSDRDIRVIDTRTAAGGLGRMVLLANQWAKEVNDPDVLEARIRDLMARERVYFVVDTLEYLYKGGRIGGATALFGSLMQVKPILTLVNGRIEPADKQRTKKKALMRIKELILQDCPRCADSMLTIMHCDAEDEAQEMAQEFAPELHIPISDIPIYQVPPAIVVHAGPKVMAVSYFRSLVN